MDWIKIFSNREEALGRIAASKPQLLIVHGKRICLVFNRDEFLAFQDACSHNGESLSKGHINFLGEIICPWHNYQFDMKSGRECQQRSKDLQTYPIKENDSGIFIGL